MWSLFYKNLFFTVIQPGIVAGLVPYWILGDQFSHTIRNSFTGWQFLAMLIFCVGFTIMVYCIWLFALKGEGTLSPAVPTRKLVISGLYKYSRNPMYLGVMLMLAGEAIFFSSIPLWIYSGFIFTAFYLFIIFHEEPRLKRVFGEEYKVYMQKVRRWL